jgi:hypothetical protein
VDLWEAARAIYEHPPVSVPLVVKVEEAAEGLRLRLDDASGVRVRAVLGADWSVPRILVEAEAARDFERLHGNLFEHLIPVLTGLDAHHVAALGGIRFERTRDGATLWPV